MYYDFHEIVAQNASLLDFAHQEGDVLWTHAGITQKFLELCMKQYKGMERYPGEVEDLEIVNLGNFLNEMWKYKWKPLFFCGRGRGGSDPVPGPLWADRWELSEDTPKNLHQFVGHTPVDQVSGVYDKGYSANFVDCLERGIYKAVVVVNMENDKFVKFDIYEAEKETR
jgi:hypothetical protein